MIVLYCTKETLAKLASLTRIAKKFKNRLEVTVGRQDGKTIYREMSKHKEVIQPENANEIP